MTASDIAVVSDGSAIADQGVSLESMLRQYATLIGELTGLSAHVVPLDIGDPYRWRTALTSLPSSVNAVFLPHVTLDCGHIAGGGGADERTVITDHDTTAIALTAAVLSTLTRAGRRPGASRVVIAGANTLPLLAQLLVMAEVGDITTWKRTDAAAFPLQRVAAGADAVIDLLGISTLTEQTVINRHDPRIPLLALPGLLQAITRVPHGRVDVEVHRACVLALIMATPPDQQLPDGPDRALATRVASAAIRALRPATHHQHNTNPG